MYRTLLGRSHSLVQWAMELLYGISDLSWIYASIAVDRQGATGLSNGPMGPRFLVQIGQTLCVLECTVRG